MQQIPPRIPGIPAPEVDDGPKPATMQEARKALEDAVYLICETSKDYSKALGVIRRLPTAEKDSLRERGMDWEKLLDAQAGMLSASKLVSRQFNAFGKDPNA